MTPQWLEWARDLQAISQNGLTYAHDAYDTERFEKIRTIAASMIAQASGENIHLINSMLALDIGHITPKIDVRGVVMRDTSILLVKEIQDDLWTLPGGWADIGASPADNAVREIFEESGYQTRAVRLLALYDRELERHGHPPITSYSYKAFFLCELLSNERTRPENAGLVFDEISDVQFFNVNALPQLSAPRVTATQIARVVDVAQHPEWPADFD